MRIGETGLVLLKDLEGYENKMYLDQAGLPTIGYGHLIESYEHFDGEITEEQAENLLLDDLVNTENCINSWVRVPLTQNEFDALVCFVFNIGCHAFHSSTMLRLINTDDFDTAAEEFSKWNKITLDGKKVESKGLTERRKRERQLFLGESE